MNKQWDSITREDLLELYVEKGYIDSEVAELFGVTKEQVVYKRRKFDISRSEITKERFMDEEGLELSKKINQNFKQSLMEKDISDISKAIIHYAFINGPIKDMNSNGQISDIDMKAINEYMNNRIATFLYLLKEQDWVRLAFLLDSYKNCGTDWDEPNLQINELDSLIKLPFSDKLD